MSDAVDVIVVGAGLAGLAAGATARAGGASVLVVDAHEGGGRARVTLKEGFTFNLGAHALYRGGPGEKVLAALSIRPDGSPPPLRRYRMLREGQLGVMPSGPGTLARCSLLSLRSKAQLGRVLTRLGTTDSSGLAGTSMETWVRDLDLRSDAEGVLRALVRLGTYCSDLTVLGADAGVAQLQLGATLGVLYLHGGWGPLLAALGAGLHVERHRPARSVRSDSGRVAVDTGGEVYMGRSVVVAAGSPEVTRRLLGEAPDWGDLGDPVTAACLDVALRTLPAPGYVLAVDRPLYATVTGPPARQAPPGMAAISAIKCGSSIAEADRAELAAHLRVAGVEADAVVHERFLARMVVAGSACRPDLGGLTGRPNVGATGAPGVFMAGDWVGPAGLLADAALASGHAAGAAALRHVCGAGARPVRLVG